MPKFKLAIGATVRIPVKFEIQDDGKPVVFNYELIGERITQDDLVAEHKAGTLPADIVRKRINGWNKQTLVLGEDGTPAPFSADAFDAMLDVPGCGAVSYAAYLKACGATEKN